MLAEKDYGFYAILDQMIYRLPGEGDPKGVSVFGRFMTAPPEGNMIELYWEAGLTMNGFLASRPHDMLGIGFAYIGVSSQIIDYEKEQGFPVIPSFEGMLEVSYTAEIMKGFYLQADFQYFWNPADIPAIRRIPPSPPPMPPSSACARPSITKSAARIGREVRGALGVRA